MDYNNQNKGLITNEFFFFLLINNISYDTMKWYIKEFSNQNDNELECIIDAFFNHYTIYLDESSNCVKFRFKGSEGNTNVKWYNDFVLSGIAFEGSTEPIDISMLFDQFELQKNTKDVKLKHIANFNGEDGNRFFDILKSHKVSILLEALIKSDQIYIHWATENLLYFSLVDIVDSVLQVPIIHDGLKNILYNHAVQDKKLLCLLDQYDYPNIKGDKIPDFCNQFIHWIDSLEPQSIEEDFALELLRQGVKSSRRSNDLIFLQDNTDKLLIENFVPIYAMRVAQFPNSELHFDECGIVENNIEKNIKVYCNSKIPYYDFINSKDNKWIQLSDIISGINGALMAYINIHDIPDIHEQLTHFDKTQNENLRMLMELKKKSSRRNKYFDHMSRTMQQIERIQFLMNYCNV